ncbi:HPP family protein [Gemmatimonadota bacterium]
MRLSSILTVDRVVAPMEADGLEEGVGLLCHHLETSGALPRGAAARLAGEFFSGARGETIRVNEWIVLVVARTETVTALTGAMGFAKNPFGLGDFGGGGYGSILLLLLTPRRVSPLKIQAIPTLGRFLNRREHTARLREVGEPGDVLAFTELMELEFQDQLLVADGLDPLKYRIYADTPLQEVVGLMVRRGIQAVPVVGEKLDFLGLITSGDVIRYLLPRRLSARREGEEMQSLSARDVMSRSVMCISEDQSLVEAANLMVNKGVNQLPVVREGELVGFLTVEVALKALFGSGSEGSPPDEGDGSPPPRAPG